MNSLNKLDIILYNIQLSNLPPNYIEEDSIEIKNNIIYAKPSLYHPVQSQCDIDPHITANGSLIDLRSPGKHKYVALSRNLIRTSLWHKETSGYNPNAIISFGDTILIDNGDKFNGKWIVVDSMNKRYIDRIDFLVDYSVKGFDFKGKVNIININS